MSVTNDNYLQKMFIDDVKEVLPPSDESIRAEAYDEGFTAGKKNERDTIWDFIQDYGRRTTYGAGRYTDTLGVFSQPHLKEFFYPKHDLVLYGDNGYVFGFPSYGYDDLIASSDNSATFDLAARLEECGVVLDTSGARWLNNMFSNNTQITRVPTIDLSSVDEDVYMLFGGCTNLETIDKIIPWRPENVYIGPQALYMYRCTALKNIAIEGTIEIYGDYDYKVPAINFQWSPRLTHDSIMNIINALPTISEDDLQYMDVPVLTLGVDNILKLTEEELLIIEQKGWNVE